MAETRIDDLRKILSQAAARDEELQHGLQALAGECFEAFGCEDKSPVWAEIKASDKERQVSEHFVMLDRWLRGDLVFEVTPDRKFVVSLLIRQAAHQRHEVSLRTELSQSVVIDPPDEKDRAKAHGTLFGRIFADLEGHVRESVTLPAG